MNASMNNIVAPRFDLERRHTDCEPCLVKQDRVLAL